MAALSNWQFWLGLGLYGAVFLLYAAALARLPLNVAHPILASGPVATVALFSIFLFREPFHWTTIAGIVLAISGVTLITARAAWHLLPAGARRPSTGQGQGGIGGAGG